MKIFSFIGDIKNRTVDAVRNFKENPIDNLGLILPVCAVTTALVGFVVSYIMFIVNGGYTPQIDLIKADGINGITSAFTNGTAYFISGNIVGSIIKIFLGAEFILMLVDYFIRNSKVKRIIMGIDIAVLVVIGALIIVVVAVAVGKIILSNDQELKIMQALDGKSMQEFKIFLIVLAVLFIAAIVTFIVLALISETRWMLGYMCIAALISFAGIPLFLLLLENIIPLIVGIIALAILGIILWFIFSSLIGRETDSGVSSNHTVDSYEKPKKESKKLGSDRNSEVVDRGFLGMKLWKVHGIMHDYVERDNGIGQGEVCSLDDLKKGRFHIYDKSTGKEIEESEIPWKPKN